MDKTQFSPKNGVRLVNEPTTKRQYERRTGQIPRPPAGDAAQYTTTSPSFQEKAKARILPLLRHDNFRLATSNCHLSFAVKFGHSNPVGHFTWSRSSRQGNWLAYQSAKSSLQSDTIAATGIIGQVHETVQGGTRQELRARGFLEVPSSFPLANDDEGSKDSFELLSLTVLRGVSPVTQQIMKFGF